MFSYDQRSKYADLLNRYFITIDNERIYHHESPPQAHKKLPPSLSHVHQRPAKSTGFFPLLEQF